MYSLLTEAYDIPDNDTKENDSIKLPKNNMKKLNNNSDTTTYNIQTDTPATMASSAQPSIIPKEFIKKEIIKENFKEIPLDKKELFETLIIILSGIAVIYLVDIIKNL